LTEAIALWAVRDGQLSKISARQVDRERRLEDWIESNPAILGERLLLIGRQIRTQYGGVIDLLAVDSEGRCVVIELKRGLTPRDIVAQALDYVSWIASIADADVRDIAARSLGKAFNEAYRQVFGAVNVPEQLNTDQRILIVAADVDEATTRIVQHLTRRYSVDINVVSLSYFVIDGQELLARTWVVDPVELEDRVDTRPVGSNANVDRTWTEVWHVNIGILPGETVSRNWNDERRYGFLSAGQGPTWRVEMSRLVAGDRVYAYLNGAGYVGGGVVTSPAVRANEFVPPGSDKPLTALSLESQSWFRNSKDPDLSEYMVGIRWSRTVDPSDGIRVAVAIRGTVRKIWSADLAATLRSAFG
jgi:hypothetical protein